MIPAITKRLLQGIPVLIAVSILTFLLLYLLPGDPAYNLAWEGATAEDIARIRASLGLDEPLPVQYGRFLLNVVQGDFGTSIHTQRSVASEISQRMPATALLAFSAMVVAAVVGLTLGIIAAVKQGSWIDGLILVFSVFGVSVPIFWIGLVAILFLSVHLHLLPTGGYGTLKRLIMPALVLALLPLATIARITRTTVIEAISEDFVRTARAKGLNNQAVLTRHVLRNALIPIVTIIGLQFGTLLSGAILTETVFTWPGVGRLLVQALQWRDFPMIRALLLVFAAVFIVVNLLTDIAYTLIDPRVRVG